MNLTLERFAYTPTETQGVLTASGKQYYTIERPWIAAVMPGGTPYRSCVPDGRYTLVKHTRPDETKTVALVNRGLGVWHRAEDRPNEWGRFLILIHAGNYVEDVVGCIAPGLFRTIYDNRLMVTTSRYAMRKLNVTRYKSITIRPATGTSNTGALI